MDDAEPCACATLAATVAHHKCRPGGHFQPQLGSTHPLLDDVEDTLHDYQRLSDEHARRYHHRLALFDRAPPVPQQRGNGGRNAVDRLPDVADEDIPGDGEGHGFLHR